MPSTALRTQDGVHFLCAELDGSVNATRTEAEPAGEHPWEHFEVEDLGDGLYALKSCHGKYLSAYSDQYCEEIGVPRYTVAATAEYLDIWEKWRLQRRGDGSISLQAVEWGLWLSPQNLDDDHPLAGGGAVLCNGPEAAGWELLTPTNLAAFLPEDDWLPPLVGAGLPVLSVEDNQRWLKTAKGRFDYRDKSAFTLLGRLMAGEQDYVASYLEWMRARRFTVARVFICNTIGGYASGPDQVGFWPTCDRLVRMCADHGIYLRACLIAATEPFGGKWLGHNQDIWKDPVKQRGEDFCIEFATRYRDNGTVILELFNEPCNIGLRYSQNAVIELGHRVKAAAPSSLLMGGHYDDTSMCAKPFDLITIHFPRYMEVQGANWIKRSSEFPGCQAKLQKVKMAVVSGEPANAGQLRKDGRNGDVYSDPSTSFMAAAMSRAHQYLPCFHSDDGLYTSMPEPLTEAHITAWQNALDAFPMSTEALWSGHWGLPAGDYWRDVWPNTDNTDEVEEWIRNGRGPWRAYGIGGWSVCFPEPQGWDWQKAAQVPVERVAVSTNGDFQAGVYRRL